MPYENDTRPPLPQRLPGSVKGGQMIEESVSNFLARYPRAFASATVTISGSVATSDVLNVVLHLPAFPNGAVTLSVTAGGSDTTTTLAQNMAAAICNNAVLQSYGIYATSLLGVVTIKLPGPLGNNVTITHTVSPGSEVETLSAQPAGGSGPIIPFNTFRFQHNGQLVEFQANRPAILSDAFVAALAAAGMPIS